jgi:hypothetical protein
MSAFEQQTGFSDADTVTYIEDGNSSRRQAPLTMPVFNLIYFLL